MPHAAHGKVHMPEDARYSHATKKPSEHSALEAEWHRAETIWNHGTHEMNEHAMWIWNR